MGNSKESGEKYITLKEASKMTGYSPDYLGQLIRKGKLEGKQVYLNVAWMTTEKAVKDYLGSSKPNAGARPSIIKQTLKERVRQWAVHYGSGEEVIKMARRIIYVFILVSLAICLFLAYAVVMNILVVAHK